MPISDASKVSSAAQSSESYVKRRLREIAEENRAQTKALRPAAPKDLSRTKHTAPSQGGGATVSPRIPSTLFSSARPSILHVPVAEAIPAKPTLTERLQQLGHPAKPIRSSRLALNTGQFSRSWTIPLIQHAQSALYLSEGYSALEQGAVLDLAVQLGTATALISAQGAEEVKIEFDAIEPERWIRLVERCGENCESWAALLAGYISYQDIQRFYEDPQGLVPSKEQIHTSCSCNAPSHACLHSTTALIAIGAWLEVDPLDLCMLRGADKDVIHRRAIRFQGKSPGLRSDSLNHELEKLFHLELALP